MEPTTEEKRQTIRDMISDLVSDFLYYDRKDAEDWPFRGDIEKAVATGEIPREFIIDCFRKFIEEHCPVRGLI